jgi:transcriptional regulator with XRE-family HTH domain
MDVLTYVTQRIRDLRKHHGGEGLSQESLAKALNVAPNTISRWETGTYRPTIEDLDQLARFFGVSITEFFPPQGKFAEEPNEQILALLHTAKQLPAPDLEELRRYAEFRQVRSLYEHQQPPRAGRKRKVAP